MKDMGVSCTKNSYGRGAGKPMECRAGETRQAGLCYKGCNSNYDGVGPVCWGNCPKGFSACGALCLANGESCGGKIMGLAKTAAEGVVKAFEENPEAIVDAVKFAGGLVYPKCPK